jgi:hypothetical protein
LTKPRGRLELGDVAKGMNHGCDSVFVSWTLSWQSGYRGLALQSLIGQAGGGGMNPGIEPTIAEIETGVHPHAIASLPIVQRSTTSTASSV